MVKLEASLAEMERELTRAEAAHMRERRELLDREAAAVADQERFRSRTILLQGEVCGLIFSGGRGLGFCSFVFCLFSRVDVSRVSLFLFFFMYVYEPPAEMVGPILKEA